MKDLEFHVDRPNGTTRLCPMIAPDAGIAGQHGKLLGSVDRTRQPLDSLTSRDETDETAWLKTAMAESHIDARIAEYSAAYTELEQAISKETQTALALKDAPEAVSEATLRDEIVLIRRHVNRSPTSGLTEKETIRRCAENNAKRELAEEDHKRAHDALLKAQTAMTEKFGKVVAESKPEKQPIAATDSQSTLRRGLFSPTTPPSP